MTTTMTDQWPIPFLRAGCHFPSAWPPSSRRSWWPRLWKTSIPTMVAKRPLLSSARGKTYSGISRRANRGQRLILWFLQVLGHGCALVFVPLQSCASSCYPHPGPSHVLTHHYYYHPFELLDDDHAFVRTNRVHRSYFYRHLHIRICHQSDGSWIHTRTLYLPAWCLELVGFHSYYISVSSRLLYYSSVESLIHFWPLERNINTINLRFSSQHSKWPLILGQKRTVICMCVFSYFAGTSQWESILAIWPHFEPFVFCVLSRLSLSFPVSFCFPGFLALRSLKHGKDK